MTQISPQLSSYRPPPRDPSGRNEDFDPDVNNEYDCAAKQTINSVISSDFLFEGELVNLTGRYARPLNGPNSKIGASALVATLQVEVKSIDKDAPKVFWVKFSDIKIVRSINS